jgi:AmmeMemoRadiSam system protein B
MAIPVLRFPPRYGETPKLTDVQAQEVKSDGQTMWALHKSGHSREEGLLLSAEGVAIAVFFDGTRNLRSVQRALYERYGQLLYVERIHELASALYRCGLLDTSPPMPAGDEPTSPQRRSRVSQPSSHLRAAFHAGGAYEKDPDLLRQSIEDFFAHPEGPGVVRPPDNDGPELLGIVAPHIDPQRGGIAYAHAYKAVAERSRADLFVVFGTAHESPGELLTLTRRSYDTPLGAVPTDEEALAILYAELGERIFKEEAAHDTEHSIEFQALFLRYLNEHRSISMLPVLCSSLYRPPTSWPHPREDPWIDRFLTALAAATRGRRVTYIAAADLSHVGRMYGDDAGPTPEALQQLRTRDLESLDRVLDGDADGFFDHVAPDAAKRRICGLTPIYMLLRATEGAKGRLARYSQWVGTDEASAVTYAAVTIDQR